MENHAAPGQASSTSEATGTNAIHSHLENFKQGIEKDEFVLLAQPVHDLERGHIAAAEILVQWHRGRTNLLPGEFLPQLEEDQISGELDFYVLAHSLQLLHESPGGRSSLLPLSFNLSAQLLQSHGCVERITSLVEAFAIDKQRIWFEIRQEMLQKSSADLREQIEELHQEGFRIVADHVGMDPGKLDQLSAFPVYAIKIPVIDQEGGGHSSVDQAAFQEIVQLCREQNQIVIGVNVEHHHEVDALLESGVSLAQGYYLARPMPLPKFLQNL